MYVCMCTLNSVIYNVNEISNLHIHLSETLELYIVVILVVVYVIFRKILSRNNN